MPFPSRAISNFDAALGLSDVANRALRGSDLVGESYRISKDSLVAVWLIKQDRKGWKTVQQVQRAFSQKACCQFLCLSKKVTLLLYEAT